MADKDSTKPKLYLFNGVPLIPTILGTAIYGVAPCPNTKQDDDESWAYAKLLAAEENDNG